MSDVGFPYDRFKCHRVLYYRYKIEVSSGLGITLLNMRCRNGLDICKSYKVRRKNVHFNW